MIKPTLVVMGGDTCSRTREFESLFWIKVDLAFRFIVLEKAEDKRKESEDGHP